MNLEEVIQKRREKEAVKPNLCDVRIPFHLYQAAINESMRRLPPREREAVRLRYMKDYSIAAVANSMGVSWDCADSLIDRGLDAIRHYLRRSRFAYTGPVFDPSENADGRPADSQVIDGASRFEDARQANFNPLTLNQSEASQC